MHGARTSGFIYCFGGVYMGFRIPKALISILSVTRVLQVAEGF